jgi:hypothetical protein
MIVRFFDPESAATIDRTPTGEESDLAWRPERMGHGDDLTWEITLIRLARPGADCPDHLFSRPYPVSANPGQSDQQMVRLVKGGFPGGSPPVILTEAGAFARSGTVLDSPAGCNPDPRSSAKPGDLCSIKFRKFFVPKDF